MGVAQVKATTECKALQIAIALIQAIIETTTLIGTNRFKVSRIGRSTFFRKFIATDGHAFQCPPRHVLKQKYRVSC